MEIKCARRHTKNVGVLKPLSPRRAASASGLTARAPISSNTLFWDRAARKYAADVIVDQAGYRATLRRAQEYLTPDQAVLEIGCGTGTTALHLAPYTRSLLAIDSSTRMIEIAREKLAASPVSQLTFQVADAAATLPDVGTYDAMLAFNVLHLMVDLDDALAQAVRALRPGGLLISKTPCVGEMSPLIRSLALPLMRAIGKAPHVLLLDGEALRTAMIRHGLQIVSIERHGTRGKDFRVFIVARKSF